MPEGLEDLERVCRDCNNLFVVTKGEQEFLITTFGIDKYSPPTRCRECRIKRRKAASEEKICSKLPPDLVERIKAE